MKGFVLAILTIINCQSQFSLTNRHISQAHWKNRIKMPKIIKNYTTIEEFTNCITHGIGILFGLVATIVLGALAIRTGDIWAIVGSLIFGVSAIMLYSASTIYHAVQNPAAKKALKKLDHISIYYLIAGTYTPFLLVNLREAGGWIIFGIIWALALLGTYLKLKTGANGAKLWSVGLYLLMGWMIVFASGSLPGNLSSQALGFLVLGGIFYTTGVAFYVWKSQRFTHAVWHLFVLAGTVMHFFAVLYGVVLK